MNNSVTVDQVIARVKDGELTTEEAEEVLADQGIFVGRGTYRRLLCAEAHAILTADHRHISELLNT